MNKLLKLILAVALATSVVSCNYVRKLINRPSSEEMEAKMRKIEQIEAARKKALERTQAEADSIKAANPRQTPEERKSVQQKAFERAEAEAMARSQAKATAKETTKARTISTKTRTSTNNNQTKPAAETKQETVKQETVKQEATPMQEAVKPNVKAAPYPIAKIESAPNNKTQTIQSVTQPVNKQAFANSKYDVVLGSFFYEENAKELRSVAQNYNYDARLVRDGDWTAVFVSCSTDNRTDAIAFLEKIKQEPFCPKDAWLRAK